MRAGVNTHSTENVEEAYISFLKAQIILDKREGRKYNGFMPNTQQIGKAGELLVQYKLLLRGIESALLTTDSGVDLVAFSPRKQKAITIQIKSNLKPKPGGGRGKLQLD